MADISSTIAHDHPALGGHFPGNPIVPGVIILERVLTTARLQGYHITGIASAKFLAPLLPGDLFSITLQSNRQRLGFEVRGDGQMFAQGLLDLEPVDE